MTPAPGLSSLAGARTLVLGATGFVGRWTMRALHDAGADVVCAARDRAALGRMMARMGVRGDAVHIDVTGDRLEAAIAEVAPDVVFDLTGYGIDRSERDDELARIINAEVPERVVRAAALVPSGWGGSRVVHAGTVLEYGDATSDLDEESPCEPATLYARTKLEGTLRTNAAARATDTATVTGRLFMVYGAGEPAGRLLPTLIEARVTSSSVALSDGLQRRDFTWVVDVVRKLLELAAVPGEPARVVNVATGVLTPVREFVRRAAAVLGIAPERLDFGAVPVRAEEMEHRPVATGRLRELTGSAVPDRIEHGVAGTLRFLEGAFHGRD